MAVITDFVAKGWFDDTRTEGEVWSIGGYVGGLHHWQEFDDTWPLALATHDVPYFHMREMADPHGPFAKWHPPQQHESERAAFFLDLAKIIGRSGLSAFNCLVRLRDLARFNVEHGLNLDPYALAAYGCMILVGQDYLGFPTELVFDHVEKVQSKLARAREYAESDKYHGAGGIHGPDGAFGALVTTGLSEKLTFRDIPALQAADFWAWEYRKNHINLNEWWSIPDRPQEWGDEQWEHMRSWVENKFGSFEEATRKSLQELLRRTHRFKPMIWHYQELCDAHKARGGVWA
jgi:hypothetical protein